MRSDILLKSSGPLFQVRWLIYLSFFPQPVRSNWRRGVSDAQVDLHVSQLLRPQQLPREHVDLHLVDPPLHLSVLGPDHTRAFGREFGRQDVVLHRILCLLLPYHWTVPERW